LPLERFVTTRTGSIGSSVGPAVTMTRLPASAVDVDSASSIAALMASTDARRPWPTSPLASSPLSGSTMIAPRSRSVATFACVAGLAHMWVSIAGAMTSGACEARTVVPMRSSAKPLASRAIVCAVAGATTMTSACCPIATWPVARSSNVPNISTSTGR
jgi:hypothetical protein